MCRYVIVRDGNLVKIGTSAAPKNGYSINLGDGLGSGAYTAFLAVTLNDNSIAPNVNRAVQEVTGSRHGRLARMIPRRGRAARPDDVRRGPQVPYCPRGPPTNTVDAVTLPSAFGVP